MILLDTNALLWLDVGHPRGRPLAKLRTRLYLSPATLLELQFLVDLGRIRLRNVASPHDLAEDDRWTLDEPPIRAWFAEAMALPWTRDPFDRLIVGHAVARGWKIATGDAKILENVGPRRAVAL